MPRSSMVVVVVVVVVVIICDPGPSADVSFNGDDPLSLRLNMAGAISRYRPFRLDLAVVGRPSTSSGE